MSKNKMLLFIIGSYFFGIFFTLLFFSSQPVFYPFAEKAPEHASPQAMISAKAIHVSSEKLEIQLKHARLVYFADTNSMDPVLDKETKGILVPLEHPSQLGEGDIIIYRYQNKYIVHRIIALGYDQEGFYAITQGDNLPQPDPLKVRWEMIEGKIVALFY